MLINGKHKFVASTDGCVSVADFVSKKLKDIEVLRGKEVKVTLGDDFELIGSSPISILGQDECVRVKTIDRKGKEEERFYSDASESEEEEEETFASEEEEDWMKPRRRSDKKNGVGVSRRKKMCGRVCVNGKICKRIAGECPWHSKGKVRKERESKDRDEEDVICAICDKGTYPAKLVLCDSCDQGYHTFCYGLEKVPIGEWVCASCAIKRKKAPPRSPAVQAKNPRNEHNEKKKKKKKVSSYANLLTYRTETTHFKIRRREEENKSRFHRFHRENVRRSFAENPRIHRISRRNLVWPVEVFMYRISIWCCKHYLFQPKRCNVSKPQSCRQIPRI